MFLISLMLIVPTAQAASCKLPKSYYKNVACTSSQGYFLASKDFGEPVALIDSQGKKVVDLLRYQQVDANKIASGLLPVQRNSKVGYLDMRGREVIPIIYDRLNESSGWARAAVADRIVVKKNGNYGIISTANKTVVPFSSTITALDNYKNGKARMSKGQSMSWVDKNGKAVADPNAIKNNQAKVAVSGTDKAPTDLSKNASHSNIRAVEESTASSSQLDNQRLATPAVFTTLQADQRDGKWGFVDENNVTMITYAFDEVRPFSEGLAGVLVDGKWGFVNLGGELVIPFRFDNDSVKSSSRDQDSENVIESESESNSNEDVTINSIENDTNSGLEKVTVEGIEDDTNSGLEDNRDKEALSFVFKAGKAWVNNLENGTKICINTAGDYVGCD